MDRNPPRDEDLVALSSATVIVYKQVMGAPVKPMEGPELNALLHDVAQALSNVAPIYGASEEEEVPHPLSPLDLMHGAFQRGATVLRTAKGIEYRQLAIRRSDMRMAASVLKRVGAKFGARRATP